ncbi:MAG: hypothetical protein RIA09_01935 [Hoeflea sp.]|uniref:hypothetical protein n=1 Tax=Hoeflea sp. TaxID=1940281 RepID=UPI0032EE755C
MRTLISLALLGASTLLTHAASGHAIDNEAAIRSAENSSVMAAFDILAAHAHREGDRIAFHMTTRATAGAAKPAPTGALAGAAVWSYVWPTSLDPSSVGFEEETGILALAATSHPDFDDTPLEDENGDGDTGNDGGDWHSHWVVLTPNEECGPGALSVRDIGEDETPKLPETWPGLPLFIDSPGFTPIFDGADVTVTVELAGEPDAAGASYDGVTAALKVHANVHAPLLCVSDVFDVASGDLSLPGRID